MPNVHVNEDEHVNTKAHLNTKLNLVTKTNENVNSSTCKHIILKYLYACVTYCIPLQIGRASACVPKLRGDPEK